MTDDIPKKFNRVFGGFAWPAENPGFSILIGEQVDIIDTSSTPELSRRYHVIDEKEDHSMDMLIRWSITRGFSNKCNGFYGRTKKGQGQGKPLPAMNFLESWNNDAYRKRVKSFYIYDSPYVEQNGYIEYHLNILKPLLDPNKKRLALYNSILKGYLLNIPQDISKINDLDFPAVSALAYAISALEVWNPQEEYLDQRQADMILDEMYGDN